jgi:hypothetical protein
MKEDGIANKGDCMKDLTVLSYGAGQDSTAILLMLIHDPAFRSKYAPGKLIVVMADTGNEHGHTYRHVKATKDLCAKHQIPFFMITPSLGFHGTAPDLISYWKKTNSIGSKLFVKSCTDRLKLRPIYKFLDHFLQQELGMVKSVNKKATVEWGKKNGKIKMLIGIAKGEESRVAKKVTEKYKRECYAFTYPLIDCGLDRKGCQELISKLGYDVPMPSNCILCPFMNDVELMWLKRFYPAQLERWIELEANKIQANRHMETVEVVDKKTGKTKIANKNFGVWGLKLLPEKVVEVEAKHGHMTDAQLNEYKFSHGHCVKSKY